MRIDKMITIMKMQTHSVKKFIEVSLENLYVYVKQLLDEVEHDIMNYQNRGLCYLPQPSASADNTDTRF